MVGDALTLDVSGSESNGYIVSCEWDFADEATAIGPIVIHSYDTVENFDVTLTVTDHDGATGQDVCVAGVLDVYDVLSVKKSVLLYAGK